MNQDPVIIDLNRYLDTQKDYTQEEQLHDLNEFVEYAQAYPMGDCAQAICDAAVDGCLQELLDFIEMTTMTDKVEELTQWQKDKMLATAMKFSQSIASELMDKHDLKQLS